MLKVMSVSQFTLLIILISFFISPQLYAAKDDQAPFYKVTWKNQQAYLLGSIHVGKADFYPMAPQIERAFEQSAALVLEADVSKADTTRLLQQYGYAEAALLQQAKPVTDKYCQSMEQFCVAIQPFAPWLQAAQISIMRFSTLGYSAEQGVDVTFAANRQSKPLLELESVAFQFELISSFSQQSQIQMLDEAVNATDAEMLELIGAWRNGDKKQLANIMEQQAGDSDELLNKLLWQRNHTMSDKMLLLMQQKAQQQLFFIIGAGHLVGQQNIPQLLRQQGAKVQDCWQQSCN
ncbi:TraB/GumN family protein [Shewanella sp. OMA3-2]|uniref:TraB/GumN family protein n=1 Tax=Shewanella sp. OMA3-2 TaxID=2908650 RepID=UPI001F196CAF|nr:TraB/GumN family protein [Shewanella sp. OMA3-2]UJF22696.1 TraB/GumN family protein [Shewanella sp. OMA3-2]